MHFLRSVFIMFLLFGISEKVSGQVYIPYRDGKLWGLADTLGHIVVPPAYEEIKTVTFWAARGRQGEVPGAFFVKKGDKYGYIQGTRVILQPIHGQLWCTDSLFIVDHHSTDGQPIAGSSRDIVYNLRGEQIIPDSINMIEAVQHKTDNNLLYTVMAPNNKSGLIWYDGGKQEIRQWIVKGATFVNIGGWFDQTAIYLFTYRDKQKTPVSSDLVFNSKKARYDLISPKAIREEPHLELDLGQGPIRSIKNNYVLRNFGFSVTGGQVNIVMKTRRYHENKQRVDSLVYTLKGGSAIVKTFLYDETHAQTYSTLPYNDFETEKADTIFEYQNYVLLKKNGKYGIICGKTIIKPVYDSIGVFKHIGYNVPSFLAAKRSAADHRLKWGQISANNKVIIPCMYDELLTKRNGGSLWIARNGKRYGVVSGWTGKVILPVIYDKVTPENDFWGSFVIEQNGKYGYADEKIVLKPVLPFKVDGWLEFQNYKVFYIKDANDNFGGYADKKGFAYFRNQ